jgi:hypothetical protein
MISSQCECEMKRRLPHVSTSSSPSEEVVSKTTAYTSLYCEPQPQRPVYARPNWTLYAEPLGPTRYLAAVICVDTLALCSLQLVDRVLSASPAAFDCVRASAVAAATALFAGHFQDDSRCARLRARWQARRQPLTLCAPLLTFTFPPSLRSPPPAASLPLRPSGSPPPQPRRPCWPACRLPW